MINLKQMFGRFVRCDDVEDLGKPTQEAIVEAIEEGRLEDAKNLARYFVPEQKALHDLFCDWIWDIYTKIGEEHGDEAVYKMSRSTQETWMLRRTWKAFTKMPVKDQVALTAEILRSHRGGPKQDGELEVIEEEDRFTIKMDPCGSGGRMRRGDPVDGTPSRIGPPYNFGVTKEGHDFCWGKKGVPYYCIHCAVNEIMPLEWGGYPMWVTEYTDDHEAPCAWHFYKKPELIPEKYFTRLGFKKPT
ncbi:hypothetical protein ACFL20_03790 [Spirochaetota bacterium]